MKDTTMKRSRSVLLVFFCAFLAILLSNPAIAQRQEGPKVRLTESLGNSEVLYKFATFFRLEPDLNALAADLEKQGYKLTGGERNGFGRREIYDVPGKNAGFEFLTMDYTKPGSKDQAALGTTRMAIDGQTVTYNFSLIAPNGDFRRARESTTSSKGNVIRANSFLSCFTDRVTRKCTRPCVTSFAACSQGELSWSLYFSCVATLCGGCSISAAACCNCNCRSMCKPIFACCRH